ncbi:MAG: radical SAM protein [Candidatus Omnitrophica bacterium]|nr:radical SAM protein [Candidatus Omnitrophota bacterium]
MRALLINPWIEDFAAFDLWSKPLGLLKIAYVLKKIGFQVRLIDCLDRFHPRLKGFLKDRLPRSSIFGSGNYYSEFITKPKVFQDIPRRYKRYGLPRELFRQLIKEEPIPQVILVTSGMTYWYPGIIEAVELLRQRFGSVPIILGGIYARLCPRHAMKYSGADLVYNGNDIEEIIKLIAKIIGKQLQYHFSLEEDYFYAYELFYSQLGYITLRTSSGCPFRCTYCGWYLLEEGFHQDDPLKVVNQIEYFYRKHNIKNFAFYDDALLYNAQNHIVRILTAIIKKGIKVNFHTPNGLHIKFINPRLARLLKLAGFIQPRLGFETASNKRQIDSGAKNTNEEFLQAVKYLKEADYSPKEIAVNIMIGLPSQSFEEIRESIKFVADTKVRIYLEEYSPVPHTPEYLKSGLPEDADPILHNNSTFNLYRRQDYHKFQELKDWVHKLNNENCYCIS